jgi:hypothetical protein
LLENDRHGEVRVERMVEDHVHEHRAIHSQLGVPAGAPVTAMLRDVLETLRAHLEAEERYLLTARVLRDE